MNTHKMKELTIGQVQLYSDGLLRWMQSGEIEMADLASGGKAHRLLIVLYESPLNASIDSNFNGMSFEELSRYLNKTNPTNEFS